MALEAGTVDTADVARVRELLEGIRVAMLTTVEPDGTLRSRPMLAQPMDADGDLWFFTADGTTKVDEVRQDGRIGVSWARPGAHRYVTAAGTCEVVRNRAKLAELWSPTYRAWFPEGLEDPRLVLLRVRVHTLEYWESPQRPVEQAVGIVKALVRGEAVEPVTYTHGRIALRPHPSSAQAPSSVQAHAPAEAAEPEPAGTASRSRAPRSRKPREA